MSHGRVSPLRRIYAANESTIWMAGTATVVLLAWELSASTRLVNPDYASAPSRVFAAAAKMVVTPDFWNDVQVSTVEFALGFVLAVITGIPLGLLAGWYSRLNSVIEPHLSALYATPRVALLPLVVLWFGIGLWSKVAMVFLGAFFPIAISVLSGVRVIDHRFIRVAHSFGASELRFFRTVVLPSSVPFILTGIRLGIGRALIGVIVGEFYISTAGIGHRIVVAATALQTDTVFVGVLLVTLAGVALMQAVHLIERHFQRWKPELDL